MLIDSGKVIYTLSQ